MSWELSGLRSRRSRLAVVAALPLLSGGIYAGGFRYQAPFYWFAVMMVAVFGTMAADGVHDGAGLPYAVTTPVFAAITAVILLLW
jgi:uncharacterized membrane-anchored protein